jgi:PTS system fructose-specific IIB component
MKIIGITACTAGVAHTYMAQAALEKELKSRGYETKIETQGLMGIENELEAEDIAGSDLVIIGADVSVEGLERFEDLKIFEIGTSEIISQVSVVVDQALAVLQQGE